MTIAVIILSSIVALALSFNAGMQVQEERDWKKQNCEVAYEGLDLKIALETPSPLPRPVDGEAEILKGE